MRSCRVWRSGGVAAGRMAASVLTVSPGNQPGRPLLPAPDRREQGPFRIPLVAVLHDGRGAPAKARRYGSSEIIFPNSASVQARDMRVRTLPREARASANLATLSPFADSRISSRSLSPVVRYTCSISTPSFLPVSRAACERLAKSLTPLIPCSVQPSCNKNFDMTLSLGGFRGGDHGRELARGQADA